MNLRNLIWFWGARVRVRVVQELFALAGIAVGVALLFAVTVSNGSPAASITRLTDGLVGNAQYQLKARGPGGFSDRLLAQVERIDGVAAAAPVVEAQANALNGIREAAVTVLAADARLARLGGTLLSRYTANQLERVQAVVLPASVARDLHISFGSPVALQLAGRSVSAPVGTIASGDQVGPLADAPIVVTSLRYGQRLAGMEGQLSRIYVVAEPGRGATVEDGLRKLADDQIDVLDTGHDGRVFADLALPNDQSTSLFAGIGAMVGFLFAFNAMLVMARDRRGLIAEMRLAGFRARTTTVVVAFDAIVLGVVAAILGIGLGDLLSRSVFEPDPGYLAVAFPVGTSRNVDVSTLALALGCGIFAALAAALVPLLGVLVSGRPMDVVEVHGVDRDSDRPRTRYVGLLAGGATCLLVTVLVSLFAPRAAVLGMGTLIIAMLLLLWPILVGALAVLDRARVHVTSAVPYIAVGELRAMSTRSIAIAAIAATAVFGTTSILAAREDLQHGLDPNAAELAGMTDVWVTARGSSNLLATAPFHPDLALARLAPVREISSATPYRGSFLDTGNRRMWVIAPPVDAREPIPRSQVVQGNPVRASARVRQGGWAVASEAIAQQEHLQIGRPFTLRSPQPIRLRLAAITSNLGWSPGTLVMSANDYRKAWDSDDASALQVRLKDGVPPAVGAQAVRAALGTNAPFLVQTAAEREASFRQTTRAGLSRLQQIATLLLVAAALATAAATGAMIWQRRRRLADLKLAGLSTTSLWKALVLESAVLLGVGSFVGFVAGLYGRHLLDRALATVTGFPVDYSAGLPTTLIALLLVPMISLAVAALPGYYAARVPAVAAFD